MSTDLQKAEPQQEKDLMLVNEGINLFKNTPQILKENQTSVNNVIVACEAFIQKYEANNSQMNKDLDDEAQALLVKINTTVTRMENKRKPITQIFTAIAKAFTGCETQIDGAKAGTLPNHIQLLRNGYAKWVIEDTQRRQREADAKIETDRQKAELVTWIMEKIGELLSLHIFTRKRVWTDSFNAITLENFEEKSKNLAAVSVAFNNAHFIDILKYEIPAKFGRLSEEDRIKSQHKAHETYDLKAWMEFYSEDMQELKDALISNLPSKKQELEQAAETARQQAEEKERQRLAEEQRQKDLAKANAEEKEKLEKKQAEEREAERIKNEKLEAERQKQEAERQQREQEEKQQQELEQQQAQEKARQQAEMAGSSMVANSLFESVAEVGQHTPAPESRTGFIIKVIHTAGVVELFTFWYQKEGVKLNPDEAMKKGLPQMKKFAEDIAKKTGEKIDSEYLVYENDVKAVNRKEKTEKE